MDRQLTIEKKGDLYHLSFHNYMGPWEGHEIEERLRLKEVQAPPRGEDYAKVLRANQAYLWHPYDRAPDLHALITEDRLPALAEIVRYKDVRVVEGERFLPEMPAIDHADEESYIAYIEKLHAPFWERGPRVIATTLMAWILPLVIVVLAVVVAGRHMGDPYQLATVQEVMAQAQEPEPKQSLFAGLWSPDRANMMRLEIRSVRYCEGGRMILGDGHFLELEGVVDAMPFLQQAQTSRAPLALHIDARDGVARILEIECGGQVLDRNRVLKRVAELGITDDPPARADSPSENSFLSVKSLPWVEASSSTLEEWVGGRFSVEGRLVEQDGQLVLRTEDGAGVVMALARTAPKLKRIMEAFAGTPGRITVDFELTESFPWKSRGSTPSREDTRLIGHGDVYSASAQRHHVLGRR